MTPTACYSTVGGAVLCAMRWETQLSQRQFADAVGIQQSHWSKLENGYVAPSVELLAVLAEWLGTTPSAIVERIDRCAAEARRHGIHVVDRRGDIDANPLAIVTARQLRHLARESGRKQPNADQVNPATA